MTDLTDLWIDSILFKNATQHSLFFASCCFFVEHIDIIFSTKWKCIQDCCSSNNNCGLMNFSEYVIPWSLSFIICNMQPSLSQISSLFQSNEQCKEKKEKPICILIATCVSFIIMVTITTAMVVILITLLTDKSSVSDLFYQLTPSATGSICPQ